MFDAIFDTRRPIPLIPNYYVSLRAAGALFLDPQNRGRIAVFLWNFVDPLCQFPGHRNPATEKKAPIFEQDIFPRPYNDHGVSIARATLRKEKRNCEKITNHSSCQQYIVRFSIVRPKERAANLVKKWTIGLLHQFWKSLEIPCYTCYVVTSCDHGHVLPSLRREDCISESDVGGSWSACTPGFSCGKLSSHLIFLATECFGFWLWPAGFHFHLALRGQRNRARDTHETNMAGTSGASPFRPNVTR